MQRTIGRSTGSKMPPDDLSLNIYLIGRILTSIWVICFCADFKNSEDVFIMLFIQFISKKKQKNRRAA